MKKLFKNIYEATGAKRAIIDACLVGAAFCVGMDLGVKLMKGSEK